MVVLSGYGDLKCRDTKQVSDILKYFVVFGIPEIMNMITAYVLVTAPAEYEPMVKVFRLFTSLIIISSRQLVFAAGIWSTLAILAILDFATGIPIIVRFFFFKLLGLPLENYAPGSFQILPFAGYVILSFVTYFPILRFLQRFREALGHPGFVLKLLAVIYWMPAFFAIRSVEKTDLSGKTFIIITSVTSLAVVISGWIYMVRYWNRIYSENHCLEMQTDLIREHQQLLKEQKEILRMCRIYGSQEPLKRLEEGDREDEKAHDYSSSEILNTAIGNKIWKCREQNLELELRLEKIRIPAAMKEIEFLSIFYNLMDNAMEAALQCEPGRRQICLESYSDAKGLYLIVENSKKAEKNPAHFGQLATTKPDRKNHGYGLKIVRELIRKNQGKLDIRNQEDSFLVSIFLPWLETE